MTTMENMDIKTIQEEETAPPPKSIEKEEEEEESYTITKATGKRLIIKKRREPSLSTPNTDNNNNSNDNKKQRKIEEEDEGIHVLCVKSPSPIVLLDDDDEDDEEVKRNTFETEISSQAPSQEVSPSLSTTSTTTTTIMSGGLIPLPLSSTTSTTTPSPTTETPTEKEYEDNNNTNQSQSTTHQENEDVVKRYRGAVNAAAEHFVCPITLQLPIDPVMAEDGNIYERSAIEACIAKQGFWLLSPCTNQPMGSHLVPAIQAKSAIEELVRTGAIEDEDMIEGWTIRLRNKEKVESIRHQTEMGNVRAMWKLGSWYHQGVMGLDKDETKAIHWYRRAADRGDVRGMACLGACLLHSIEIKNRNETEGMFWLGAASNAGSDLAAYNVGVLYLFGTSNLLPRDEEKAKIWFAKIVNGHCSVKHASEEVIQAAASHFKNKT